MEGDVGDLLASLRLEGFRYQELNAAERSAAAATGWPAASAADLDDRPEEEALPLLPPTVAVVGAGRGAGATMVVANLALILAEGGGRCLVAGLDSDDLARHLGEPALAAGVARRLSGGSTIARLDRPGGQLRTALAGLVPAGAGAVLVDAGLVDGPGAAAALGLAEDVLVVLRPSPDARVEQARVLEALRRGPPGALARTRWIVNGFDARRSADRELLAALRGLRAGELPPLVVQEDPVVAEALAAGRPVLQVAAESQVLADLGVIAQWLAARRERPRRPGRAHG
jgi:MinD-like ATPase involved in chromosome partitioning or flagellar assembly